jgi:hypothetical protein
VFFLNREIPVRHGHHLSGLRGVLADFDGGARSVLGMHPSEFERLF